MDSPSQNVEKREVLCTWARCRRHFSFSNRSTAFTVNDWGVWMCARVQQEHWRWVRAVLRNTSSEPSPAAKSPWHREPWLHPWVSTFLFFTFWCILLYYIVTLVCQTLASLLSVTCVLLCLLSFLCPLLAKQQQGLNSLCVLLLVSCPHSQQCKKTMQHSRIVVFLGKG